MRLFSPVRNMHSLSILPGELEMHNSELGQFPNREQCALPVEVRGAEACNVKLADDEVGK